MTIGRLGTVFVRHSAREPDHAATRALAEALTEVGLDVWWDRDGLEGGDSSPSRSSKRSFASVFFCSRRDQLRCAGACVNSSVQPTSGRR